MSKNSGSGGGIGGAIFVVIVIIAMIPKEIWIALGVIAGGAAVICVVAWVVNTVEKHRAAAEEQARVDRAERARAEKQRRVDTLGRDNASLVESALAAVQQVTASEAAREGWLGDIDFTADLRGITESFEKAHALREVTGRLAALRQPSADDRRLLAEARTTVANLERVGVERVELIGRCAREAQLVDRSLQAEREDARIAGRRAELHAELSAMLYGIEATPSSAPVNSAVDAVLARVQAYRELKVLIRARGPSRTL